MKGLLSIASRRRQVLAVFILLTAIGFHPLRITAQDVIMQCPPLAELVTTEEPTLRETCGPAPDDCGGGACKKWDDCYKSWFETSKRIWEENQFIRKCQAAFNKKPAYNEMLDLIDRARSGTFDSVDEALRIMKSYAEDAKRRLHQSTSPRLENLRRAQEWLADKQLSDIQKPISAPEPPQPPPEPQPPPPPAPPEPDEPSAPSEEPAPEPQIECDGKLDYDTPPDVICFLDDPGPGRAFISQFECADRARLAGGGTLSDCWRIEEI